MSATSGAQVFWHREDTAAAFTTANPILAVGEYGIETDTLQMKRGDGATAWTSLNYTGSGSPATAAAAIVTTATTQSTPFGFATQAQGDNIRILINQIRAALVARGIMV
jgi:hypothetical protein